MTPHPSVPRVAAGLVSASIPAPDRSLVLGDLQEQFVRRAADGGLGMARRWYWAQAIRIVLALGPRRALDVLPMALAPGTMRGALRSLSRAPGISLAAAATLGVGIAAPLAMFALAGGVTSSLPGDPDDRIVRVSQVDGRGTAMTGIPWSMVERWREDRVAGPGWALTALAAFRSDGPVAVGDGEVPAGSYWGVYATSGLFRLAGGAPILGRLWEDDEDLDLPAALIREDLWGTLFDRTPDILGKVLRIDGVDHRVVGVLPRSFGFPVDHSLWMQRTGGEDQVWSVVGQLAPGASARMAREQLQSVLRVDAGTSPRDGEWGPPALSVEEYTRAHFAGDDGDELSRYTGWVSLILVILTALNVAALMLARGVSRARETAIRRALGASRFQVVARTLTEALLLAMAGGVMGLMMGQVALGIMVRYVTSQATIIPYWMDFSLGEQSLVLAGLLVLLAVAVSGVLPALRTSRADLDPVLRTRPHDTPGRAVGAMTWLVGIEVTLSCFLLSMAGVVVEKVQQELRTGVGFPTQNVLTGRVVLDAGQYPDRAGRSTFLVRLLEAVRAHPSVEAASLTVALPGKDGPVLPVGLIAHGAGSGAPYPAQVRSIDPAFMDFLEIPILAGRTFQDSDDQSGEPVAIVNEAFTLRHGISGDPLGRTIAVEHLPQGEHHARIIGVAADRGVEPYVRGRPVGGVYLPFRQVPAGGGYLLVRPRADGQLPAIWHEAVGGLDPYLPLGEVLSLEETLRRGHGVVTLFGSVFLALGASTLLVALVGLYGVHSFSMARRIREIGLRRALGAGEGRITWESVGRGLRPVGIGVLLGAVPGVLTVRLFVPAEPSALGILVAPLLLLGTSLFALWRPTRAASAGNPMEALREG